MGKQDIPLDHRIVLAMTFDNVMVRRHNFGRLTRAMRTFAADFGAGSLLQQADKIQALTSDQSIYAVCWNQTSVNSDTWQVYHWDQEQNEDTWRMYDISKDEGHWFLFKD